MEFTVADRYYRLEATAYRDCTRARTLDVVQERGKLIAPARANARRHCAVLRRDYPKSPLGCICPTE